MFQVFSRQERSACPDGDSHKQRCPQALAPRDKTRHVTRKTVPAQRVHKSDRESSPRRLSSNAVLVASNSPRQQLNLDGGAHHGRPGLRALLKPVLWKVVGNRESSDVSKAGWMALMVKGGLWQAIRLNISQLGAMPR